MFLGSCFTFLFPSIPDASWLKQVMTHAKLLQEDRPQEVKNFCQFACCTQSSSPLHKLNAEVLLIALHDHLLSKGGIKTGGKLKFFFRKMKVCKIGNLMFCIFFDGLFLFLDHD